MEPIQNSNTINSNYNFNLNDINPFYINNNNFSFDEPQNIVNRTFPIINDTNGMENNNLNQLLEINENNTNTFDFDSFENIDSIQNDNENNLNINANNSEVSDNSSISESSNQEDTSTVNSCDINISNLDNNNLFNKFRADSPLNLKSKMSLNSDFIFEENKKRRKSMDLIPFNKFDCFKKSPQFKVLESTYYQSSW